MNDQNCRWIGILALAFVFITLFVTPTNAAVTQIGSASFTNNTNTLSFTVPAGNDRLLLVVASDDDNVTMVSSVTFGASSLVQRATETDGFAVDTVWTLSMGNSASPTTANITVVSTGPTPNNLSFIAAVAYSGVSQSMPISGLQTATNNNFPSMNTFNVVSATGSLVFDVWDTFTASMTPTNTVTPGGSQTVLHNSGTTTVTNGFAYYRTSTRPGAASVPMSWTTSNGGAMVHIAFSINAAPVAASVSISGRVLTPKGSGVPNAIVSFTDQNGQTRTARTSSFGYYQFDEVQVGQTVVIGVMSKGYQFNSQVITAKDNVSDLNFTAIE